MTRFPDWQSRLQNYLDTHRNTPFTYGQLDCCLFSCDCVQAMTGQDMAEWFRGKYNTRKRALELIKQRTGHTGVMAIAEYAADECGLPSIPILMAQRGDMVVLGKGTKALLGIVSMSGMDVMCQSTKGIIRVAFEHATRAWRV